MIEVTNLAYTEKHLTDDKYLNDLINYVGSTRYYLDLEDILELSRSDTYYKADAKYLYETMNKNHTGRAIPEYKFRELISKEVAKSLTNTGCKPISDSWIRKLAPDLLNYIIITEQFLNKKWDFIQVGNQRFYFEVDETEE